MSHFKTLPAVLNKSLNVLSRFTHLFIACPPDRLFQRSDGEGGLLVLNPLPVFPEFRSVFAGPFEQQTHGAAG